MLKFGVTKIELRLFGKGSFPAFHDECFTRLGTVFTSDCIVHDW